MIEIESKVLTDFFLLDERNIVTLCDVYEDFAAFLLKYKRITVDFVFDINQPDASHRYGVSEML